MKLSYHTPAEWADVTYDRLRKLGCSPEYAEQEKQRILRDATAEPEREQ